MQELRKIPATALYNCREFFACEFHKQIDDFLVSNI